jgi:predicted  nucleic acid-binding Zn-ribbon protein
MNLSNNCAAECSSSQPRDIPIALEELSSRLYGLEERVEALRDRLKPVTVQQDEKVSGEGSALSKAMSQFAECVEGYADRVALANYKLDRLLVELQI